MQNSNQMTRPGAVAVGHVALAGSLAMAAMAGNWMLVTVLSLTLLAMVCRDPVMLGMRMWCAERTAERPPEEREYIARMLGAQPPDPPEPPPCTTCASG